MCTYTVKTGKVIQLMPLLRSLRGNEASVTQQLVSNRILHFHCIAIDCGRLRNPPFGRVDLAGTVINARATYACIPGYVLIGNKFQICLINGRWSGETPVCRLGESLSLIPLPIASYHSKFWGSCQWCWTIGQLSEKVHGNIPSWKLVIKIFGNDCQC